MDIVAKAKLAKKLTQEPGGSVLGTTSGVFPPWFGARKQFGLWGRDAKDGTRKKSLGRFPNGSFDTGPNSGAADGTSWMTLAEAAAFEPEQVLAGLKVVGVTFFPTTFTDHEGVVWHDCVLDLDACRDPETKELTPFATTVSGECLALGAWCEISPSRTGLKIFGKLPAVGVSRKLTLKLPDGSVAEVFIGRKLHLCLTGVPVDPNAVVGDSLPDLSAVVAMLQKVAGVEAKAVDARPVSAVPQGVGDGDSHGRSVPKWFNSAVDLWSLMASDGWTKVTLSPKGWLLAHPTKGVGTGHSAGLTLDGMRVINWSSSANISDDEQGHDAFGYWCAARKWNCADPQVLKTVEQWLKTGPIGSPPTVLDVGPSGILGNPRGRVRNPYNLVKSCDLKVSVPPWLSPGVLPKGVPTLITGRAGHGKSAFVRSLVAQLASGHGVLACPTGPIQTLWLCFEDNPTSVLVPALIAEGLTLEEQGRILCLTMDEGSMVPDSDGFMRLTETLDDNPGIGLLIIDTLAHWATPAGIDLNSQDGVRKTVGALQTLCMKRELTAVVVAHEVKSVEAVGTLRAAGSMQIGGACRLHWSVVSDGDGEAARLVHMKNNLGMAQPPVVRFRRRMLTKVEALEQCAQLGVDTGPLVDAAENTFGVFCRQDIIIGDERFEGEPLSAAPCFQPRVDAVALKRGDRIGAAGKAIVHKLGVLGAPGTWHEWTIIIQGLEIKQSRATLDSARGHLAATYAIEVKRGVGQGILVRIRSTPLPSGGCIPVDEVDIPEDDIPVDEVDTPVAILPNGVDEVHTSEGMDPIAEAAILVPWLELYGPGERLAVRQILKDTVAPVGCAAEHLRDALASLGLSTTPRGLGRILQQMVGRPIICGGKTYYLTKHTDSGRRVSYSFDHDV